MVSRTLQCTVRAAVASAAAAFVALAVASCQDTGSGPKPWLLEDVHARVGLAGGHQQLACADCHGTAQLTAVAAACEGCHLADYDTTTRPAHRAAGYGTACADCHSSRAWSPAAIDHARFGFALEGAHARAACAACHPPGSSDPLGTDCWSCHADEFGAAASPPHVTLGFGTDCRQCHTAEAWTPAVLDHEPFFPIRSGSHRRYRDACASCHLQGGEWVVVTCTGCHDGEHRQGRADSQHREVRGYRCDSAACYACHPTGRSGDD